MAGFSKTEILAELPRLTPTDLAEVQRKLDELWGDPWDAVKARVQAKLRV